MKTDNELIAEFMNVNIYIKEYKHYSEKRGGYFDVPKYNTSWEVLIPVIEKIGEFGVWTIRPGFAMLENYKGELRSERLFKFMKSTQNFEEVNGDQVEWCFITACVCLDFIKWHNSQKP